jgi:anti-anti-sigma factor
MLRALSPTSAVAAPMDLPPSFVCAWRTGSYGSIWVDLAGELDLMVSAELARMLHATQARSTLVVLDLRELTFMDVAGARVIARGSVQVDMVFALTGTSDQVELFDLDSVQCPSVLGDGSHRRPARALRRVHTQADASMRGYGAGLLQAP